MSYLDAVRLTFHGDYQADVSTVNNDVRHYALDSFEDRFQAPSQGDVMNGWWNPTGSNALRLLNCRVGSVGWPDGRTVSDPAQDPACALAIGGPNTAVSAKLVDLDPQWQMSPRDLGARASPGRRPGVTLMREPSRRRPSATSVRAGQTPDQRPCASAMFVSVLTGVTGTDESIARSPCLTALRAASAPACCRSA
jgi:hypothetical protein